MDPRDHRYELVDGAECAACGRPVPADQVRILASREDLAFAELPCEMCGSISLAIFVAATVDPPPLGEAPPDSAAPAIGADDVLDMHLLLESWQGDLRTLVAGRRGHGRATDAA